SAPVAPHSREAVLGARRLIEVADQAGAADELVPGERGERALGPREPLALPDLRRDRDRDRRRHVLERLQRELVVRAAEGIGALGEGDDLHAVGDARARLVGADRAHLLDLAPGLGEAEARGERERAVVVDERAGGLVADALEVRDELAEERRAEAAAT